MNAQRRLPLVSALLVISLASSTFADVLVLKDGTLVDGDVDSLLRGTNKAIQTPDGRSVGLSDAVATHLGVTTKELKAGIDRSSFISDRVRIDLVEAFIFETGADEKREQFLQVNVNVTNRDERRYLSIETPGFFSNNYWRLKDDVANKVRESHGDRIGELKLLSRLDRIKPEKTANGAILFEPALPKTEYLVLDLAPPMFEFNERLAFIRTAFLLIPFDSVSTPETRFMAANEAVERYERTVDDADSNVAKKLLGKLAVFGEKRAAKLHARWKLVPIEHTVSHLENTAKSMQPIDWSKIDVLRAASEQVSDEEVRDSLLGLCRRAALAIVKHGEATLETDLDSALQDYWIARLLSVDSNAKTKTPPIPVSLRPIEDYSSVLSDLLGEINGHPQTAKTEEPDSIDRRFRKVTPQTETSVLSLAERLRQDLMLQMKTSLPSPEGSAGIDALIGLSEQTPTPSLRSPLSGLRKRTALALTKRVEATLETNLDSALQDYWNARLLISGEEGSAELRGVLADKLVKRFRARFAKSEISEALADYVALRELAPESADGIVVDLEKVPPSVLSQLPLSVLSQLPPRKNSLGMAFKPLPGGTFMMGEGNEAHQVTLTKAFELGVYEVTQEQYEAVMGKNPSKFKGSQNPVEKVSWDDAVEFCRKLSELPAEKKSGYVYRLPTEAEWEYACRAMAQLVVLEIKINNQDYIVPDDDPNSFRTVDLDEAVKLAQLTTGNDDGIRVRILRTGSARLTAWTTLHESLVNSGLSLDSIRMPKNIIASFGDSESELSDYAWYDKNSGDTTHPVGEKKPNAWGLYDMYGNVYEWCQDWHGDYPSGSVTDPIGPGSGSRRVLRGGSFFDPSSNVRSAVRDSYLPDLRFSLYGFRPARTYNLSP
jgi:formylglycine-generating enzyme required for sulfatase activity